MAHRRQRGSTLAIITRNVRSLSRNLKKNSSFFIGGVIVGMEVLLRLRLGKSKDRIVDQIKVQLEEIDNPIHVSQRDLLLGGGCYELYAGNRSHIHIAIKGDELVFIKEDMR